jgi:hypothetical protein
MNKSQWTSSKLLKILIQYLLVSTDNLIRQLKDSCISFYLLKLTVDRNVQETKAENKAHKRESENKLWYIPVNSIN